jgi:ATP-dependent RNA helicase DDX18/HAS1
LSQPPDGLSSACRCATLQGYCVVPAEKRFLLLFTFLKKNANKKARHCCSACCC